MQKVTYTNEKGLSIVLSNSKPLFLERIEGTGAIDVNVQLQKAPYQDGSTYIDSILEPRQINMTVIILSESQKELYEFRQLTSQVFNPKFKGVLKYKNDYLEKEIPVVIDRPPFFPGDKNNLTVNQQRLLISVLGPMPFWLDLIQTGVKLEDFVASFRFPMRFPVRFSTRGDLRTLINAGDVPTPILVEFRGPALNPKVVNETTGEFIRVKKEILTGQKLLINTEFGNKYVKLIDFNGAEFNAFSFIDLESSFFALVPGENKISFITDGGNPEVFVRYKNRYVGV